jgi:hypothetical protein
LTFEEAIKIFVDFHERPAGRHFGINIIVRKILAYGY